MELLRFDPSVSSHIDRHGSSFLHCVLSATRGPMLVSVMYLRPSDHVGRHDAVAPQLFAVIEGSGHVSGESGEDVEISAGQAAFWSVGESHGAKTDIGMTAIVLEGASLNPRTTLRAL